MGPTALKYLGRRPLKLVRHVGSKIFYHKRKLLPIPEAVRTLTIEKREGGEGVRVWVDTVEGLIALARGLDAVELHPWNATIDDIETADQIVLDLDPGEGIDRSFVVDTVLKIRELMEDNGLRPWPKVTGGKGYHLMASLQRRMSHDQARTFAKNLAEEIAIKDRRYKSRSPVHRLSAQWSRIDGCRHLVSQGPTRLPYCAASDLEAACPRRCARCLSITTPRR